MARIGKCYCGKELYGTEIFNDVITEVGCANGHRKKVRIVPKQKREAITAFERAINRRN